MIGIKQVLLLASLFLMVCSVFGSDDAAISQRELHVSTSSDSSSKVGKKGKSPSPKGGKSGNGDTTTSSPTSDITATPTSEDSIPIRVTHYAMFYTIDQPRIPSTTEYARLAEVTRIYLEEFMVDEFSGTSLTNLDDFLTFMIRNSFTFGEPVVQADYRSTGLFNPSSIFLPTVRELDGLITTAFTGDNLDEYIRRVQLLPSANIFSTTSAISKGFPDS
uniref:Subtilisin n=1 Tax=Attheya septentrionalis TaxID=420275 RepID=A0A7S2UIU3_9STRA|mmetsp:Transcript_24361/g.44060  ORF Transcript_24361/g.44060 Transcript_24361/m.44060 type:complete len:219 (+) Transcript_24361:50-706(+)|eukprot:CAMPEP_0198301574 /NCGR_PEP_ID=MMETSP1449-20131203/52131_1 /TAXON_ID=420275 /ORGANISM="Attheya septentrionalis, Strain CCMP2084" /LENGTH=218 /DNA_ID=CAMNT_0044003691 /DNA_START=37 /DNA_END=693 /DNA_ORIENTATION=-